MFHEEANWNRHTVNILLIYIFINVQVRCGWALRAVFLRATLIVVTIFTFYALIWNSYVFDKHSPGFPRRGRSTNANGALYWNGPPGDKVDSLD